MDHSHYVCMTGTNDCRPSASALYSCPPSLACLMMSGINPTDLSETVINRHGSARNSNCLSAHLTLRQWRGSLCLSHALALSVPFPLYGSPSLTDTLSPSLWLSTSIYCSLSVSSSAHSPGGRERKMETLRGHVLAHCAEARAAPPWTVKGIPSWWVPL